MPALRGRTVRVIMHFLNLKLNYCICAIGFGKEFGELKESESERDISNSEEKMKNGGQRTQTNTDK